jgi:replicative DNA helicase
VELAALQCAAGRSLPEEAFALPKRSLRDLLRTVLQATTLPATLQKTRCAAERAYALRSRAAAAQVSVLLLRFGISCSVEELVLRVTDPSDVARLQGQIESGLFGAAARDAVLAALPHQEVAADLRRPLTSAVEAGSLGGVAAALASRQLELEATNDVRWDAVVSIEPDGVEEVFDATVVGNHNFVADGVAVHNSIEQDADMVVLLHREDAYEKESPRAGEADFIVAKHRNGPTATITVAFQGHYSRFVDMSSS